MRVLWIVIALVLGWVVINFIWRWSSRRRSLPCPTLFAPALASSFWSGLLRTEATLDRLGLRPGQHVLEIGPGPGRLLIPAAKRILPGGEAVGIDIQAGMIERLQDRARSAGIDNLTGITGDATQPIVESESFDVVFLCTTLGEIPDREAALNQSYAALKPGGLLSITELFPDPHYQRKKEVLHLASAAGFQLKQIEGTWAFYSASFVKPLSHADHPE